MPAVSSRTISTSPTPLPSDPSSWIAVELRSPSVSVEWAAVVRSAWQRPAGSAPLAWPAPPQLTISREAASLYSKASVEAQAPASERGGGGGAASKTSTLALDCSR